MTDAASSIPDSVIEQMRRTRRLPVRLRRETPWGSGIGLAMILGLLFIPLGAGIALIATYGPSDVRNSWLFFLIAALVCTLGILLIFSAVYQWLGSRVREPIVEIDAERIFPGQTVRICVRQEGPVTLDSLTAQLVCVERRHQWKTRATSDNGSEEYCTTAESLIHSESLIDEHPGRIATEEFWEQSSQFLLPDTARLSLNSRDLDVIWRIEIVGSVPLWPDNKHPYVLRVESREPASV